MSQYRLDFNYDTKVVTIHLEQTLPGLHTRLAEGYETKLVKHDTGSVTIELVPRAVAIKETLAEQEARMDMERKAAATKAMLEKASTQSNTITARPLRYAPNPTAHVRLIEQVEQTTRGRRDNYGRPLINFLRIALLWDAYMQGKQMWAINPLDVAQMMNLLKIARVEHSFTEDSLLDMMGYDDCVDDMNQHMIDLGYIGIDAVQRMDSSDLIEILEDIQTPSR